MKKFKIDRRYFLKGVGATLALPMLNIMAEGNLKNNKLSAPKRLACFFFPDGVSMPPENDPAHKEWNWFPIGDRKNYKFTNTLRGMEPFKDVSTVLSGLSNPFGRKTNGHNSAGVFLTAADQELKDSSGAMTNTVSIDQLFAQLVGDQTRISSLVMSTDGGVGLPTASRTMSYDIVGRPIFAESSPRRLFKRLFEQADAEEIKLLKLKKSALDTMLDNIRMLQKKIGKVDKERLDHYLQAVREVEKRIQKAENWIKIPKPTTTHEINKDVTYVDAKEYVRTMYDLIWLAFQSDSTRVATYQIGQENASGVSDLLGMAAGFRRAHALTHQTKEKDGWKNLGLYNQFLADEFANFLKNLNASKDGLDPLLDNTLCYFGSGTSKYHTPKNFPLILAGGKNMGFKHGQFLKYDENKTTISDLYLTMIQQLGVKADKFGISTGTLSELV